MANIIDVPKGNIDLQKPEESQKIADLKASVDELNNPAEKKALADALSANPSDISKALNTAIASLRSSGASLSDGLQKLLAKYSPPTAIDKPGVPNAPLEALKTQTNTPQKRVTEFLESIKKDGTALARLSSITPEKLREYFPPTLNKGDIFAMSKAFTELAADSRLKDTISALKPAFSVIVDTMLSNGFSIDTPEDIALLKEYGNDAVKKVITPSSPEDVKTGTVLIRNKGGNYELTLQSNIDLTGSIIDKAVFSNMNTLPSKEGQTAIVKAAMKGEIPSDQLSNMVNSLANSENGFLGKLGKFFKTILTALGLYKESGVKKAEKKEEVKELTDKEKIALIDTILKPGEGGKNGMGEFEGTPKKLKNPDSPESQKYLQNLNRLFGIKEPDMKDEKFQYGEKIEKAVKELNGKMNVGMDDTKFVSGVPDEAFLLAYKNFLSPKKGAEPVPVKAPVVDVATPAPKPELTKLGGLELRSGDPLLVTKPGVRLRTETGDIIPSKLHSKTNIISVDGLIKDIPIKGRNGKVIDTPSVHVKVGDKDGYIAVSLIQKKPEAKFPSSSKREGDKR